MNLICDKTKKSFKKMIVEKQNLNLLNARIFTIAAFEVRSQLSGSIVQHNEPLFDRHQAVAVCVLLVELHLATGAPEAVIFI